MSYKKRRGQIKTEGIITEVKRTPIPLWKWILLHFVKTYKNFDCEGDLCCLVHAKILFKQMYIWRIDDYDKLTGKRIKTVKLTRKG